MRVLPFCRTEEHLDKVSHAGYLERYLRGLGCRTVVIEEEYVDKEYLIDYTKYYARSFVAPERFTIRFHFFLNEFSDEELGEALIRGDGRSTRDFKSSYLGFVVAKPVREPHGKLLIGRTVLRPYSAQVGNDTRHHISVKQTASLFGLPLKVESLPFQTQDTAVGACATTALWISAFALKEIADVPTLSLAEITEQSVEFPGEHRNFPSEGLTMWQMLNFINALKLDVEVLAVEEAKAISDIASGSLIPDFVKAFITCGLPVIGEIRVSKGGKLPQYHAVVISGYRSDEKGVVKELYVHDDQIGPYSRVLPQGDFSRWNNEWTDEYGYDEVAVEKLLVPVYPKIRLPFSRIYKRYLRYVDRVSSHGYGLSLHLSTVNSYKQSFLKDFSSEQKMEVLTSPLPRFLWVIRAHYLERPITDLLYDATWAYPRLLRRIDFDLGESS